MAVMKLEITEQRPLLGGKRFGSTGSYDMLKGRITFAVDPVHPRHRGITDLDKAPRTAAGQVEWWADFCLLQPTDPARGNHRLFFEAVNRGRILAFRACSLERGSLALGRSGVVHIQARKDGGEAWRGRTRGGKCAGRAAIVSE
jgi:hypothetical protein